MTAASTVDKIEIIVISQTPMSAPVIVQQQLAHITSVAKVALNEALGLPASKGEKGNNPTDSQLNGNAEVVGLKNNSDIDAKEIQGSPSLNFLVHHMFDKDEEMDESWQNDIHEDFEEESTKYGGITKCIVMHLEPGGKIHSSSDTEKSAKNCALALAGRWFDKRQLKVEYVKGEDFPIDMEEIKI